MFINWGYLVIIMKVFVFCFLLKIDYCLFFVKKMFVNCFLINLFYLIRVVSVSGRYFILLVELFIVKCWFFEFFFEKCFKLVFIFFVFSFNRF